MKATNRNSQLVTWVSPELREQVERSADEALRSISQEIALRLRRSFQGEGSRPIEK